MFDVGRSMSILYRACNAVDLYSKYQWSIADYCEIIIILASNFGAGLMKLMLLP